MGLTFSCNEGAKIFIGLLNLSSHLWQFTVEENYRLMRRPCGCLCFHVGVWPVAKNELEVILSIFGNRPNEYKNHQTYWKICLRIFSILNEDKSFFYLIILERFAERERGQAYERKKNNEREEENEEEKGEKQREAETSRG